MKLSVRLLPALLWFGLILYLLTIPGEELPEVNWMDGLPIDKVVHITLFLVLVLLSYWGIVSTKPGKYPKRKLLYLGIAAIVYGIVLEFVQKYWVPNRSFDGWDIVADGTGSFLPLLFSANMLPKTTYIASKKQ
jgi:VanZ family protein